MNLNVIAGILILSPLVSFVLLALFGKKMKIILSSAIGTVSVGISLVAALYVAYEYFFISGQIEGVYQTIILNQYNWLQFNNSIAINMGMIIDPISVMMLVVITLISLMVHIYSITYMLGEDRYSTYFAYLSLFTFSMLGLVLSVNILQMYIFWELVGVSSFLLIGFYFTRPSAIAAAKKAFIVTRFADLGFLIGILIVSYGAQTLEIPTLIDRLTNFHAGYLSTLKTTTIAGFSAISIAMSLIFMGGAGKSAMFPLHIWLPDAMEGPTPVSALIHAATMVVAGVYLVARLFPIYAISVPDVLTAVGWIGVISAFLAAIIACTQTDIKRVLAYSTISQIGFMLFALGVAQYGNEGGIGYTASMFHLFTHAFFKALLFLAAGIVIHAVHSNEISDMGGLRKVLPITHILFLFATLAISGIPPFAGFFSKEAILTAAHHGNAGIFYIGLITSFLTAFYMFRLYFKVFWHKTTHVHHAHESWGLVIPIIILGIGTIFSGFIPFEKYVSATLQPQDWEFHLNEAIIPVSLAIIAIFLAGLLFQKQNQYPQKITGIFKSIYRWAYRKFYFDELYIFITKKIIFNLIGKPIAWFDRNVVDGFINSFAFISEYTSNAIKGMQSGNLQSYAMYFLGGTIAIGLIVMYLFSV